MPSGPRATRSKSQAPATRSTPPDQRRLPLSSKKLHCMLGRRTPKDEGTGGYSATRKLSRNGLGVSEAESGPAGPPFSPINRQAASTHQSNRLSKYPAAHAPTRCDASRVNLL